MRRLIGLAPPEHCPAARRHQPAPSRKGGIVSSLEIRNLRRDPGVALSAVDFHDPYQEVQIRGRVVEFRDDSGFEIMDEIPHRYTGKPFPFRGRRGALRRSSRSRRHATASCPFSAHRRPSCTATGRTRRKATERISSAVAEVNPFFWEPCQCADRGRSGVRGQAALPPRNPSHWREAPASL